MHRWLENGYISMCNKPSDLWSVEIDVQLLPFPIFRFFQFQEVSPYLFELYLWQMWFRTDKFYLTITWGAVQITARLAMMVNRVYTIRQRRSITMAANFQSASTAAASSSCSGLFKGFFEAILTLMVGGWLIVPSLFQIAISPQNGV